MSDDGAKACGTHRAVLALQGLVALPIADDDDVQRCVAPSSAVRIVVGAEGLRRLAELVERERQEA